MNWTWYLVGAGLWMFWTGIAYGFAEGKDRRWCARTFFAFPIWPVALGWIGLAALIRLWNAAEWRVR